jgi:hypothetical protein
MREQRLQARADLRLGIRWNGLSHRCEAVTSDISLGGCYVETFAQLGVGQRLWLDITLPAGAIQLYGQVLYQHPGVGFGVRFLSLSVWQRKRLASLISCAETGPLPFVSVARAHTAVR